MPPLIQTEKLCAGYGTATVVRDLDLEVNPGEVVALLGPNGAGKTTTLMTIAGELPTLGGRVLLNGKETKAPLHLRVREGLGVVSEERTVLMRLTVAENLKVCRGDVDHAIELFPELKEHYNRRVGMLSGGQQQMLSLARALSRRPTMLLADELSLGLAPLVVTRLLDAVRKVADEGVGVLLVEQHIHKALEVADRAYVLRLGEIQLAGSASDLLARIGEVQQAYFTAEESAAPTVGGDSNTSSG
jgi:ABC-type branched-subunit amino acid transport system ATPase component